VALEILLDYWTKGLRQVKCNCLVLCDEIELHMRETQCHPKSLWKLSLQLWGEDRILWGGNPLINSKKPAHSFPIQPPYQNN